LLLNVLMNYLYLLHWRGTCQHASECFNEWFLPSALACDMPPCFWMFSLRETTCLKVCDTSLDFSSLQSWKQYSIVKNLCKNYYFLVFKNRTETSFQQIGNAHKWQR
jgi:hypothetical protein